MKRIVLAVLALSLLTAGSARGAGAVTVDETKNGTSISVHPGDTITVTLKSALWTINDADGKVLKATQEQQSTPGRPGPGCCGSAFRGFVAVSAGTANLTADRTTCGEALKCTPAQSHYSVRVTVLAAPSKLPFTGFSVLRTTLLGLLLLGCGALAVATTRRPRGA